MATYKKLLYSVGGGIISDAQLDAQNGSATIAIGLGGTGKDAIKRLKKEVYQRIAPDNPGDAVARYDHIKYLSIDTDENDLWNTEDFIGIDANSEFFPITGDPNIFTNEAHASILAGKPYAKWLNCRNIRLQSPQGAGGVRQIGRYFLIDKSDALVRKLETLFTSAVQDLDPTRPGSNDVNIHIMTGLGGGTGSGTFLDVCYLVRRAASICTALTGKHIKICGYFFMPDVNLSKITQGTVRDYIMYNSFAVMKELDYCMNLTENGDKWKQQYNGFMIETAQPPVDVCYLVSSQSVNANVVSDGYEYAMGVVSDYVVQFISDSSINMDTHIANYARAESQLPKPHGGNYKYVIIGASHSIVPMREISTYLASKLFEKMTDSWANEPTDADIAQFCTNLGLTCEELTKGKKGIGGFQVNMPTIDNVYNQLPTDDSGDKYTYGYVLPENILAPFNKIEYKICGETLKKGQEALTNPWEYGMALDDEPISIVCRVYKGLDEVVKDAKRGPLYAAKMLLGSDKMNIINVITGVAETAKKNRDDAFGAIDMSTKAVRTARAAYNNRPKLDPFGKKKNELFDSLLAAIQNDIRRRCEYERYRLLCEALATAKEQLQELHKGYFAKYADVIMDLKKVFEANKVAIADLQDVGSDPFMLPLFKISEVRKTLDAEVNKLGMDTAIASFNNEFYVGAYEVWHTGNEDKIARWITRYMSETFKAYIELSLDDHIRRMYPDLADDDDVSKLVQRVQNSIIQKLDAMASELFLLDGAKAQRVMDHTDTLTYCSAPMTAPIVNQAIEQYREGKAGITHVSGSKDRIFFLKSSPCVPMFAYGQVDVNYSKYAEAEAVTGKHLYEGAAGNGDPRNWQKLLPNLRPYSIYQHIDWTTADKQATAAAYGAAEKEAGIIQPEIDNATGDKTGIYYIWRTPNYMPKLEAAQALADSAQVLVGTDVTKENEKDLLKQLKEILPQLKTERENLQSYKEGLIDYRLTYSYDAVNNAQRLIKPEIPPIMIRNDGDKSTEATAFNVRRDNVLASPVLMKYVEEELQKYNAYQAVMEQLRQVVASATEKMDAIAGTLGNRDTEQPTFIHALLSGVLTYSKRHSVTFEDKDEFGIENHPDIELSKPAAKPYGGIAPLYQAFNTYCDLPTEIRSGIRAKVDQRLNGVDENDLPRDWTEEMQAAYNNLTEIFTTEYVHVVAMSAKALPEYADIMGLYRAFLTAQKTFKVMYGL